jgi:hypothetical protein
MPRVRPIPGTLVALAILAAGDLVAAQDVVVQKPLTRRFPLNFCPFETRDVNPSQGAFGLYFTATTAQVTLRFEVPNENSFGFWGDHRIDNIVVVATSVYTGNNGPSLGFEDCYTSALPDYPNTGPNAPAFYFNRFGPANVVFSELFDTTPAGDATRPWDLSQGAYYLAQGATTNCQDLSPKPSSAPRNPEQGSDCANGALGLGRATDGNVVIKTSIPISGLTPGTEYIVTGWWDTNDFSLENALTVTVVTSQPTDAPPAPGALRLAAAPNPFNPSTRIQFELALAGETSLDVLDIAGRHVATLVREWMRAGAHSTLWDGRDAHGVAVASGVYIARLRSGAGQAMQRLVLVR